MMADRIAWFGLRSSLVAAVALLSSAEVARAGGPCMLSCPADITVSNDPNKCTAVVDYRAPGESGDCEDVACTPSSGSIFPVGTTTVTCQDSDSAVCSFTVTVNDTQPPVISCSDNIDVPTEVVPVEVVYPSPEFFDNCPGATVACVPPSGSLFESGETLVTCTATDAAGNTASCSFLVRVLLQSPAPVIGTVGLAVLALGLLAVGMGRRGRRSRRG
jgi:hypothetical protein